jgi:hypothetical protein
MKAHPQEGIKLQERIYALQVNVALARADFDERIGTAAKSSDDVDKSSESEYTYEEPLFSGTQGSFSANGVHGNTGRVRQILN